MREFIQLYTQPWDLRLKTRINRLATSLTYSNIIVILPRGYFPPSSLDPVLSCPGCRKPDMGPEVSHFLNGGLYGPTQLYSLSLCILAHGSY